jgi:hypothetical protein
VENDSATPTAGLSDRITESSSQPSTGVVIFDSGKSGNRTSSAFFGLNRLVRFGASVGTFKFGDPHRTLRSAFEGFESEAETRGNSSQCGVAVVPSTLPLVVLQFSLERE